jgi:hypothetical protein
MESLKSAAAVNESLKPRTLAEGFFTPMPLTHSMIAAFIW